MKVLVCGGREFRNVTLLNNTLDKLLTLDDPIKMLINGGARGADTLAHLWAVRHGIQTVKCDANWSVHGKAAGHKRNLMMLLLDPDLVIAFPGGTGTAMMIRYSKDSNVPVWEIRDELQSNP